VRLLELLRDVLVFVPVLVTWWQLRYALLAYNNMVNVDQRDHTASVSFLLGWIRGFDNQTWPLSRAALVVATVIALVIACTLIAHFWRGRIEAAHSRVGDRAELGGLLVEGTLLLARIRRGEGSTFSQADIESMVRGFYENSDRLTNALRETSGQITRSLESGPATRLEKAINEWSASARELREVGQSLKVPTQVMDTLRELERSLAASALQLTNGVSSLVTQLADHTDAAGQEAAAHIGMAREVSGMTAEVISAFDTFARRLEQLGNLVDELRTVIDRARMSDAAEY
jgi:methyl-accepting chemotaxis protein